ncbi:MAG TPA: Gfo/Idh/MocA family oxidoreductase, partial [Actinomycetota bacterium]
MRVALFGCGWIQDFHARGVLAHGDELAAVANHREGSAREFADRYSIPHVTTDWQALAADPEIDAAIVATPNVLHAPQAIALLEAGTHVMVEKPMAISVASCDAMIAASKGGGAWLMVAHCWRFRDEVIAMRDRIRRGEFGDVVRTHGYGVHAG